MKHSLENLAPWDDAWNDSVTDSDLVSDPLQEIMQLYFGQLRQKCLLDEANAKTALKVWLRKPTQVLNCPLKCKSNYLVHVHACTWSRSCLCTKGLRGIRTAGTYTYLYEFSIHDDHLPSHFQPYIAVEEQINPDPYFSTVIFPNPEENDTLKMALKTASNNQSTIVLANDPDADRLACAELQPT